MSIMEIKYDIGDFVPVLTEQKVLCDIVNNVRKRRKEMKLSQKKLATRSGVSYASIRRFESCGEISFNSLLKIADVLNCLNDFTQLFSHEILFNLKEY